MAKSNDENYNVPGLEKGLAFLELLASSADGLTLLDITAKVEVTSTTAYRILSTLVRMGYVEFAEHGKRYRLTRKLLRLGYQSLGEHDIVERVLPAIRALRDDVKESVFFGVLGEEKGVFIEQAQGLYPFKFVLSAGASFELHNSAPGKVIMAFSSPTTRERYLAKMSYERCTDNTITTRAAYLRELDRVREIGYSVDMEESLLGVVCVGAAIFDYESRPVGSIWVSGPNSRFAGEVFEYTTRRLLETTRALSREFGYKNLVK